MKSFLKWAGGKSRLLPIILPELQGYNRLIEPFVGSGVVFLNSNQKEIIINDFNSDLIITYKELYKNTVLFITALDKLFKKCNNQEDFTRLRTEFNTLPASFRKAVIFVYLNRHSFNGLCRYNSSGGFNVPYGKYSSPYFPEKELREVGEFLNKTNITFLTGDFLVPLSMASDGDVVYCDPPYVPISNTSTFTAYSAGGFSLEQQNKLIEASEQAYKRGAKILISNHDCDITRELYKNSSRILELDVTRSISAKGTSRIKVKELIAIYE
jgi:DNA adenine methylase